MHAPVKALRTCYSRWHADGRGATLTNDMIIALRNRAGGGGRGRAPRAFFALDLTRLA